MYYDLHTHTCYSDGTLSPADLVARAAQSGVQVLALTDHDVTDGIAEAQAASRKHGLVLVPGVEISVSWQRRTLHILGLGIDPGHEVLQAGLARLRARRDERAVTIGERLEKKGIAGALAGAHRYAGGSIISRTHFARFLTDSGHARDMRQAFKRYLADGMPGYAPVEWVGLDEALGWIRASGGQAVIAHPARYKLSAGQLRRLFSEFKDAGGVGIEVVSGSHSRDDYFRFAQFAKEFDFLASAGSDYHGPENAWMELGRLPALPAGCTPLWTAWPLARSAASI